MFRPGRGSFLLHVLDAESRAEMRNVAVHAGPGFSRAGPLLGQLPDESRIVSGDSPLTLEAEPDQTWTSELVVVAPGRAATLLKVALRAGGETTVVLERGSTLSVEIAALPDGVNAELRLHHLDRLRKRLAPIVERQRARVEAGDAGPGVHPFHERFATLERGPDPALELDLRFAGAVLSEHADHLIPVHANGRREFEHLAAGKWVVSLVERIDESGYCRGFVRVDVATGERAASAVSWIPRPDPRTARIRGTLRVGREWATIPIDGRWIAILKGRGQDSSLGSDDWFGHTFKSELAKTADPSLFAFDFGRLPPGRYVLLLPRFGVAVSRDVSADTAFDVVVPPPVEVEVTLQSFAGGRVVTDVEVEWGAPVDFRDFREVAHRVNPDLERGCYRFFAPEGPIVVCTKAHGEPFATNAQVFRVGPDSRSFSMTVRPPRVDLDVILLDGDQPLPQPWNADFKVERDGKSAGGLYSFPAQGTHVTFRLEGPGRYRISAGALEGYEPPAPIEVDVREGEKNVLRIPMVRRR